MHTFRQFFIENLAQTSNDPMLLELTHAKGCQLFDVDGKAYLDLISGITVSGIGHGNEDVIDAVNKQVSKHMHLMVYGEVVQPPQVEYARTLTDELPYPLKSVYFTNSGAEAIEGAMKLAKRFTGRHEIIAFNKAYHGSTQGALSLIGDEYFRNAYRPLLPGVYHYDYDDLSILSSITSDTACVIIEAIQAEAGVVVPSEHFLKKVRERCTETGALFVLDEIQTGFHRTGPLMAFMDAGVVPDILVLAKALGGGMPLGAFIASREMMSVLSVNPALGHITTFGGHPVSCAAGLAAFRITQEIRAEEIRRKEMLFRNNLVHKLINKISGRGLLLAVHLGDQELAKNVVKKCLEAGVFTDWFLFAPDAIRIAPPLIIEDHEIFMACEVILKVLNEI